ncbi:unnamed protein product [Gemmata massiliana]|uniref:Lipoprotein n=1 Tax=Gemmata massiliana TaxID=1210884 RepID=A0A6P2D1K0_9BACT|nr:hypothetical protein [Gemmata massiliana]VTR93260.1 unnamed protein product [Gemmata massiliana]
MTEPTSRQHKALTAVALVGLAVLGCSACLISFGDRPFNGVHLERLEADLNARLPNGSSQADAEAWFARHAVQPGEIFDASNNSKIGLTGTVPNNSLVSNAEIRIELYFSADGKLKDRVIYRHVYTL